MSENSVLTAFQTLLSAPPFMGTTPPASDLLGAVYTDLPKFPYQGKHPFVVVNPLTQTNAYVTTGLYQNAGFYRLVYFDDLSLQSGLTEGQIMSAARTFVQTLRTQIRSDYTLGGAVFEAGEGPGIVAGYTLARRVTPLKGQPLYAIPVDVYVVDVAENVGAY